MADAVTTMIGLGDGPADPQHLAATLAGAQLVEARLLPVLQEITAGMPADQLLRVHAGVMASLVGASCGQLGSPTTVGLLQAMVATAGRIEADLAGRH
jgi:hypothetical protein